MTNWSVRYAAQQRASSRPDRNQRASYPLFRAVLLIYHDNRAYFWRLFARHQVHNASLPHRLLAQTGFEDAPGPIRFASGNF